MIIKDIQDAKTGEKIYLAGHAEATYMSNGSTVEEALNEITGGNYEKLTVIVTGVTEGFTIYVMDENGNVIDSQTSTYKVYRIPTGVRYYVIGSNVENKITPEKTDIRTAYNYTQQQIVIEYKDALITTIRINQNTSDPSSMITRIVDEGGIEYIRANSHRYAGTFDSSTNTMTLKQLDDNDSTKYLNGSVADLLTTDVWMKLPQFWYKCEEYATDIWDFTVCFSSKPDDSYKEWDGKDLIGVFEGFVMNNKLRSIPDTTSSFNMIHSSFKTYAQNRGTGFSLVKWKHHCMMAMLFYVWYGNTNSQAICGSGTSSSVKTTGTTNTLGMTDTIAGGNGDSNSINFWGLENWWGNKYEFVDNVTVKPSTNSDLLNITEDDGTVRQISIPSVEGYISKMMFGENIDLIPKYYLGSSTTGFCDYHYDTDSANSDFLLVRSGSGNIVAGGISHTNVRVSNSYRSADLGARIAFRGNIVIIS